jgi:ketosteroid isomerase-like protein
MSEENVEIVREAVEAFNDGNLDAAFELVHPDIELRSPDVFPDAATYRGVEAVREFFETWLETFQGFRLHLEDCVAAGDERVLATLRVSGQGVESGASVESPKLFQLIDLRDGKILRASFFPTETEALEAARLSE